MVPLCHLICLPHIKVQLNLKEPFGKLSFDYPSKQDVTTLSLFLKSFNKYCFHQRRLFSLLLSTFLFICDFVLSLSVDYKINPNNFQPFCSNENFEIVGKLALNEVSIPERKVFFVKI